MSELSSYTLEPLVTEANLVLSRGTASSGTILIMTHGSAAPAPSILTGLRNAYRLRDSLDSSWATHPRKLIENDGRVFLVLDDPGGSPLVCESPDVTTT